MNQNAVKTPKQSVSKAPKAPSAPKKKKKIASLDARKARSGWLFVLPFVLAFVIIYIPIIFDSIRFSFCEIIVQLGGGYKLEFVGLLNYSDALFSDANFVKTLTTGLTQLVIDIPAIVIFSLFMAILLNQKMAGRAAFRAIFFIPVILSTGLIEQIDADNQLMEYMDSAEGIATGQKTDTAAEIVSAIDIQALFANMKVGTELVEIVVSIVNNIFNIVNRSGVQMLIFLAGLQSISPAIYESCQIEGASAWETFWKITLPMISPMILVNTIYTVIDSFTTNSNQVMVYIGSIYDQAKQVLSSAMAWIYFLIVMLIIAAVAGILSAYTFYQRRD